CKIEIDDTARSILVSDPSGNTFFMDGAGNMNVNVPKNMTLNIGENLNISVGKDMNTGIGNDNTVNISNNNRISIKNDHSFDSNNYTQSIHGNKEITIAGNLDEKTSETSHIAKNGDITIRSAGISRLLGQIDALVNKG
ncbi:bacteriophage T4 gp5 trimerisation domain-containing protein, partial [Porphyromonas macacae]